MPKNHLHEVFFGNNRINSMKYGCIVPLCALCHSKVHNDIQIDLKLKKELEKAFIKVYECDTDFFIKFNDFEIKMRNFKLENIYINGKKEESFDAFETQFENVENVSIK